MTATVFKGMKGKGCVYVSNEDLSGTFIPANTVCFSEEAFFLKSTFKLAASLKRCLLSFVVSVTDAVASAVFQTMLTVCHRNRPKLCKQLLRRITEYLTSRSAAPGVRQETKSVFMAH